MPEYNINDLLKKFRQGTILPEEQAFLETWYLNWNSDNQHFTEDEINAAKSKVWLALNSPVHRLKPWYWLSAVAGILLFIIVFWFYKERIDSPRTNLVVKKARTDFKPGGNKAILTLANGEEVSLGNPAKGEVASQGTVQVTETETGKLVYKGRKEISEAVMINKLTTPRGGEYQLVLSDGTKVWLNAASSISFPAAFEGNYRKVSITGEVYFEVAHDKKKPFLVTAREQEISVLGTHFNISAYQDDEFVTTSLISGAVRVKNLKTKVEKSIQPGQSATTSSANDDVLIHAIDKDEILSWKNGYFQFDNQNVYSIMKVLSRWYNVDVQFLSDKNTEHFGGTFSRGKQLSEILANLEKLGNVHFTITPKKVIVTD
ncbi:FecR family protein [Pedobacter suwonensis]|uniref:FecR family protein n=1 Tax=Pedobacter suwonensis TaxID=332999 RepID=A0A1I0SY64_9SPHI|nr:FecR family protein [Pedobacter suwonensis]SFA44421.1 FecR family protein [Pedobacter suwonensis]